MSALPEKYRKYAAQQGQRPIHPADVELYGERQPVAWVPSAENPNVMVAVPKQYVQPMQPAPPRDLTPVPLFDPQAQRLFAGGLGVGAAGAGLGFGLGQLAAGIAMMGTSGLAILAGLLLAAGSLRGRGVVNVHNESHTHVTQKWLGRTSVTNNQ
ncbi:hypothetical protein [Streptomyces spinosirectus]